MKKRILSILLTLCMLLCLVPTSVFAEGEAATGTAAIQFGIDVADVLNKNINTASAATVYFGQDHENNPGAWRVFGYNGSGVAGAQDGLLPFMGANGNWWIGEKDTGVKAAADSTIAAGSSAIVEKSPLAVIAVTVAGTSLLSNIVLILYIVLKKKKGLV